MHRGYVPLWRKLKESSFYKDSEAVHLWIHILLEANHSPRKEWFGKEELLLGEGQFTTGRKQLAADTGIGESKIQRLLKKFEKCHMIEQQTCSVNRLISVVNYSSHKAGEQPSNNERTTSEQRANNERTHPKNVITKELKETITAKPKKVKVNKYKEWDKDEFWKEIVDSSDGKNYSSEMIKAFYFYWLESNEYGKTRLQSQDSWSTGRRLATWSSR